MSFTSELASQQIDCYSERKKGVGSEKRVPIHIFLPLDYAGEVFACMARCILHIYSGARINDANIE